MTPGPAALLRPLVFAFVGLAVVAARPGLFPARDFPEYWSAAVVAARGGDPYDGGQLLPVQQSISGDHGQEQVVSLWTPPWTLPLYLPFGLLGYDTARLAWVGLQLLALFASVELLGRCWVNRRCEPPGRFQNPAVRTAGSPVRDLLPHLLAAAFAPTFWLAHFGQNTALLLLGLAGFVHFRSARPFVAGCFAALTAVKPHLLAAFGVLLILDLFRRDGWKVLTTGVGMLLLGSLVAIALNPQIFEQFVSAVGRPATPETVPLSEWDLPLLAHKIRHAVDPHRFWIQFVPCGLACLGLAVFRLTRGSRWDWVTMLPAVVLVSCLCAPYGGWIFDLVVLLVPVIHAAAVLASRPVGSIWLLALALGFGLISLFGFLIPSLAAPIWFTPAVGGWYAVAVLVAKSARTADRVADG